MSERDFDKGYKSGFQFGKEVANVEWLNKIKQAREEIMKECSYSLRCFNEDAFDEDNIVVDLDDVLIILGKLIESEDEDV